MSSSEIPSSCLLNRSFLNGLRSFRIPEPLWKPCGNHFVQKSTVRALILETLPHFESCLRNMLNIRTLRLCRALWRDAGAGQCLTRRFSTFAQVCSRESTDEYSFPHDATHSAC